MAFFSDILFSVPLLSCMMSDRESFLIKKNFPNKEENVCSSNILQIYPKARIAENHVNFHKKTVKI